MSFEVTVVEFLSTHLIGMKVRTNMQNAQKDCPAIWQTFGPHYLYRLTRQQWLSRNAL